MDFEENNDFFLQWNLFMIIPVRWIGILNGIIISVFAEELVYVVAETKDPQNSRVAEIL